MKTLIRLLIFAALVAPVFAQTNTATIPPNSGYVRDYKTGTATFILYFGKVVAVQSNGVLVLITSENKQRQPDPDWNGRLVFVRDYPRPVSTNDAFFPRCYVAPAGTIKNAGKIIAAFAYCPPIVPHDVATNIVKKGIDSTK